MKKVARSIVALVVMGLLGAGGAAWGARTANQPTNAARVHAPTGEQAAHGREIVAPAIAEAEGDVRSLAFESSGRVVEVNVKEGDRVAQGDVLARLDDGLARARVKKAEAALAAAQARLAAAQHGALPDEISAARAEASATDAIATTREREATRARQLGAMDALPSAEVDAERGAAESARAHANAAASRLALVRAGVRTEQRQELAASVDAAKADVEESHALLQQMVLRAPRGGTVLRRLVEPGEQVTNLPPTVVVTMADVDHVRLRAEVDEVDVSRVQVGRAGYATTETFGDRRFAGHIVHVERELGRRKVQNDDPRARLDTRVLEVVLALDDPEPLPLGLRMVAHFEQR